VGRGFKTAFFACAKKPGEMQQHSLRAQTSGFASQIKEALKFPSGALYSLFLFIS